MPIKIVTVTKFNKRVEIAGKMCYNNKAIKYALTYFAHTSIN